MQRFISRMSAALGLILLSSCSLLSTHPTSIAESSPGPTPTVSPYPTAPPTRASSPVPSPPPSDTPADLCQQPFREVIAWPETFGDMCNWDGNPLVTAGETYLENCLDPALSPAGQPKSLERFRRLAQLIPPAPNCPLYTPTVQLMDLDRDGVEEILLHTQIYVVPGFPPCYDRKGGASIVYDRDDERRGWRGTLIWPPYFGGIHHPEPDVRTLDLPGSPDQTFVSVAGRVSGADYAGVQLIVWHWNGSILEEALDILLSDWCAYSNWDQWEIDQDGDIVIPAAEATWRCEAREAVRYVLRDGVFIEATPTH